MTLPALTRSLLPLACIAVVACEPRAKEPGEVEFDTASEQAKNPATRGSGNTEGCTERAELASQVGTLLRGEMSSDDDGRPFLVHCHESEEGIAFLMYVPDLKHFKDVRGDLAELGWLTVQLVTEDLQESGPLKLGLGMRGDVFYGVVGVGDAASDPTFDLSKVAIEKPLFPFFLAKAVPSRPLPEGSAEEILSLAKEAMAQE